MKERVTPSPGLPAVPETSMELLTSAFLMLESSSYLTCLKSSTISRLMYSICRDSPAQQFQVWCECSCGSRPSSASGHKGDLTPRVWRVTGESPRRGIKHICSNSPLFKSYTALKLSSLGQLQVQRIKVRQSLSSPRVFASFSPPGPA